jgi:ribosome-binding factor A
MRETQLNAYRVSLRSKDNINVARVAEKFGGGGHKNASGCRVEGDWDTKETEIIAVLTEAIEKANDTFVERDAKVFVVVQGGEDEIKTALRALQNAATFVRQQVALNLDLRHAPHINFMRDTVEENAVRIDDLIQDLTIRGELQETKENEG